MSEVLETLLSTEGYRVDLAKTGEEGLEAYGRRAYDVVLLDVSMPGIGGLAVLHRVRRSGPNASTPVIVVSAVKDEETIERCMSAGAQAYLTKPVRPAELARTVRKILGT